MRETLLQRALATVVGWGVALLLFFPIAWMVLTSFKTEVEAITPRVAFTPTLASYAEESPGAWTARGWRARSGICCCR